MKKTATVDVIAIGIEFDGDEIHQVVARADGVIAVVSTSGSGQQFVQTFPTVRALFGFAAVVMDHLAAVKDEIGAANVFDPTAVIPDR